MPDIKIQVRPKRKEDFPQRLKDALKPEQFLKSEDSYETCKNIKFKRIIINQFRGGKRWIRLICLEKEKTKKSSCNVYSFEELENQFKSLNQLMPTFRLQSDKNIVIKRLEDFFEYDENSFVLTYFLDDFNQEFKTPSEYNNEKVKLLIGYKDINFKYINIEMDSFLETIVNIKIELEKKEGINKYRQRLIFNCEELVNENSSLLDNFIQNGAVLTLKIIAEEELTWLKQMPLNFGLKKIISNCGGCIQSPLIDLKIPAGSVDSETEFLIEKKLKILITLLMFRNCLHSWNSNHIL